MEIGYNSQYEHYTEHNYKKKRPPPPKEPYYININVIIFMIIIITPIVLLSNYCINNFDIDLDKEYEYYEKTLQTDKLLMGKRNMCQYVGYKFYTEIFSFKNYNISIIAYISIFIIILLILISTGVIDYGVEYLNDSLTRLYNNRNDILENFKNMELVNGSAKVYKCFAESYLSSDLSKNRNKKLKDTITLQREPDNFFTKLIKSF